MDVGEVSILVGYFGTPRQSLYTVQGMIGEYQGDLDTFGTSCDVTPMVAKLIKHPVIEIDQNHEGDDVREELGLPLDNLTRIMLSQGFILD